MLIEGFDYGIPLPYECRRDKDVDGSTMLVSTKPFGEGETEQFLCFSPKGKFREITVLFSYPQGFEKQYIFSRNTLRVTGENKMTRFGEVDYNKAGMPLSIHLAPFYVGEYVFWRDAPTEGDREIIDKELARYDEAFAILWERYGVGNIPMEALPNLVELCPKYSEYRKRWRDVRQPADFFGTDPTRLVFKQGKWVVVEQVEPERNHQEFLAEMKRITEGEIQLKDSWVSKMVKTRNVLAANWEEAFLYDEKMFTISQYGNQLVFRQESIGGTKKKIIQVPIKIDYGNLQRIMADPVAWEKVAEVYPANFYAEL